MRNSVCMAELVSTLAAALWISLSILRELFGHPAKIPLQKSNLDVTNVSTIYLVIFNIALGYYVSDFGRVTKDEKESPSRDLFHM